MRVCGRFVLIALSVRLVDVVLTVIMLFTVSVWIGDWQLLRRIERNHLRPAWGEYDLFFDPCRGYAVTRRTISLDCEDHAGLEFDRLLEGVQARNQGPFVQAKSEPMAKIEAEGFHFAAEADVLRLRESAGDPVAANPGFQQADCPVHPLARIAIGGALRRRCQADVEGS